MISKTAQIENTFEIVEEEPAGATRPRRVVAAIEHCQSRRSPEVP